MSNTDNSLSSELLEVFEKPVNKDMTSYFVIEEINYEVHYAYASFDGSNP